MVSAARKLRRVNALIFQRRTSTFRVTLSLSCFTPRRRTPSLKPYFQAPHSSQPVLVIPTHLPNPAQRACHRLTVFTFRIVMAGKIKCSYDDCHKHFKSYESMIEHKIKEPTHEYCKRCDVDCEDDIAYLIHQMNNPKHSEYRSRGSSTRSS